MSPAMLDPIAKMVEKTAFSVPPRMSPLLNEMTARIKSVTPTTTLLTSSKGRHAEGTRPANSAPVPISMHATRKLLAGFGSAHNNGVFSIIAAPPFFDLKTHHALQTNARMHYLIIGVKQLEFSCYLVGSLYCIPYLTDLRAIAYLVYFRSFSL